MWPFLVFYDTLLLSYSSCNLSVRTVDVWFFIICTYPHFGQLQVPEWGTPKVQVEAFLKHQHELQSPTFKRGTIHSQHRQEAARSLCKCLATGTNPGIQQFLLGSLPRSPASAAKEGVKHRAFLPLWVSTQHLPSCKGLHPRKLCSFLISSHASYEVANPLSFPPCPDQRFAFPGCPELAAAGSSATPVATCGEIVSPSARAIGFCECYNKNK